MKPYIEAVEIHGRTLRVVIHKQKTFAGHSLWHTDIRPNEHVMILSNTMNDLLRFADQYGESLGLKLRFGPDSIALLQPELPETVLYWDEEQHCFTGVYNKYVTDNDDMVSYTGRFIHGNHDVRLMNTVHDSIVGYVNYNKIREIKQCCQSAEY